MINLDIKPLTYPIMILFMVIFAVLIISLVITQLAGVPLISSDSANLVSTGATLSYLLPVMGAMILFGVIGATLERK